MGLSKHKSSNALDFTKKDLFSGWHSLSCHYSLIGRMRYPLSFSDRDIDYYLKMLKGQPDEENKLRPVLKSLPEKDIVILLRSRHIGTGDEKYSEELLHKFVFALTKILPKPKMIISLNEAVKLMNEDSPVLESLRILEKQGVKIYVSSSCAEFYKFSETIKIGTLIDIYDICSYLLNSSKVISL
jgi:hypothetical protein